MDHHFDNEELIVKHLCGDISGQELDYFNSLLNTDEGFRNLYASKRFVWEQSLLASADFNQDWQAIATRVGFNREKLSPVNYFLRVAAIVVVMLSVSTALWVHWNVPGYGRWVAFETSDTADSILLPDASMVYLNSNSSLKFRNAFAGPDRGVFLQGEGYFNVVHDGRKPFKVHAGDLTVKVVGTSFHLDTSHGTGHVRLNVSNGAVLLSNPLGQITISTGEWAMVNDSVLKKGLLVDNNFKSWITGVIEFTNSSLEEIATVLDNHFPEIDRVAINSPSDVRVTTRFQNPSLDQITSELSIHFHKKFALENGTLTISD